MKIFKTCNICAINITNNKYEICECNWCEFKEIYYCDKCINNCYKCNIKLCKGCKSICKNCAKIVCTENLLCHKLCKKCKNILCITCEQCDELCDKSPIKLKEFKIKNRYKNY